MSRTEYRVANRRTRPVPAQLQPPTASRSTSFQNITALVRTFRRIVERWPQVGVNTPDFRKHLVTLQGDQWSSWRHVVRLCGVRGRCNLPPSADPEGQPCAREI